jgi:hypothetical protein
MKAQQRHRWVRLREHFRICRKCGCGRETVTPANNGGDWGVKYHRPTGESVILSHVPPCEVGPRSTDYLRKYAEEVAAAQGGRSSFPVEQEAA